MFLATERFILPPVLYVLEDRLNLPSVLVLNGCGISRAGDHAEIAAFCSHVMELDLSHNKLHDWHEVLPLLQMCALSFDDYSIALMTLCEDSDPERFFSS